MTAGHLTIKRENFIKMKSSKIILIAIAVAFLTVSYSAAAAQGAGAKAGAGAKQPASAKPASPKPVGAKAAAGAALLPTQEQVNSAMQRVFGYDAAITWNIIEIKASPIAGLADVFVSINKQAPQHIYFSPKEQLAIPGQLIPFGDNPFVATRQKLRAADGPTLGPKTPVIEIVEFSDLQCPHCKAAAPIVEKLAADFPNVRVTFQQFPLPASLHPWAMKGALYADCAGHSDKAAFWKYIDAIFENQGSIALATADDKFKELATATGLDANKLAACAESKEAQARVQKSLDLGQVVDVTSTPTVFINGRLVTAIANIPYESLKSLVQFEIDHAGK
jgi:protein-disulfide isomerase